MIQHPLEIPRAIHEAFHIARTGRPGPVVVDIPTDLSRADIAYEPVDRRPPARLPADDRGQPEADPPGRQGAGRRAAARCIYAGGGVVNANAAAELVELATRRPLPGHLHADGPRRASRPRTRSGSGMLGMHGTRTANYAMDEADLICAIGARFDDRITGKLSEFAPRAKFIHIDVDPAEISKNVPAHIPIVGDAKNILAKLRRASTARSSADPARLDEWWQRIERLAGASTRCATRTPTDGEIKPQYMVQALYEATGGDAIVTSDVGQHQMWAAQYYHFDAAAPVDQLRRPRARWASACRRRWARRSAARTQTVVCIAGDGSIQMNMQELATCAQDEHRREGRSS